jgi:very-short-patch-repair endonuclease
MKIESDQNISSPLRGEDQGGGGLVSLSQNLRKNTTIAERYLWKFLRNKQLGKYKFRRQQPIGKYIVDFVNFEKNLIIELDGGHHAVQKEEDRMRDEWLKSEGFEVLRFWNNEVLKNIEGVAEVIRKKLLTPHLGPLPQGERIRGRRKK